jgi:arylsulfatase A-like enzyme
LWASGRYQVSRNDDRRQFAPKGYLTDYFAQEADAAITANKNNPFFMFLSLTAPHTPYQALKSDYDQLSHITDELTRVYAAMIVALDRAVGTVLASLKKNGLTDDTLVIFTNDNGAPSKQIYF